MNAGYACLWLALICIGLPTSSGRTAILDKNSGSISRHVRQTNGDDRISFGEDEEDESLDSYIKNYSDQEKQCLAQQKILSMGKCHGLTTTGPCAKDEWLVLDTSSPGDKLRAICKKKTCTGSNEVWWPSISQCITKTSAKSQYCQGDDKIIVINPFGEGTCACTESHGSLEGSNQCHEYYQRGPCKRTQVLTYDILTGNAICSSDKCLRENSSPVSKRSIAERDLHHVSHYKETNKSFRNMEEDEMLDSRGQIEEKRFKRAPPSKRREFAPQEGDGPCYKLRSATPCTQIGPQSRFVVDQVTHVPRCSSQERQLQLINPSAICNVDGGNNCIQSIKIDNKNTVAHSLQLRKQLEKRRQK